MAIEYEATFPNINKDEIRERLKKGFVLTFRRLKRDGEIN